ncbi:L,D-transpeptidase family protein [Alteriqipengyuania sp. WL0013]|uniref:L,D-transpeptidase family protein n=1 Tax=Alteriqipengyuania sp. WL0013 TaxID=3110773 RepID=UPI002BBEBF28|nr:L,D-transpeptidase family protein [Alteriqipengyuania sp. WL0013]MEB3415110.1 L,D-transpeptidase family protein [Alteriqipengyuania sp. WL0013]
MRFLIAAAPIALLAACGLNGTDGEADTADTTTANSEATTSDNEADTMASNDPAKGETYDADIPDSEERPIMQAQVVLDRRGFGPGVIDGKMGMSTENALNGFQEANDLEVTGKLDEATKTALAEWSNIPATRVVTIPESWGEQNYEDMPEDVAEKAEMKRLGYKSIDERLAERFHTTVAVLKELNPGGMPATSAEATTDPEPGASASPSASASPTASPSPSSSASGDSANQSFFTAGQQIRVPNIGADRIAPGSIEDAGWKQTLVSLGVGSEQPEVDRVVVSKAGKTLKAYNGDKLVAMFTVSSGSSEFPLPLGEWDIVGEAYNPPYKYDPEVLGNDDSDKGTYTLPPGPNSPVGVVWIDLSKEHYGIHGTPDPETIGRAQSSGCVRLTNWDAARLAGMVSQSTRVIFEA